MSLISFQKSQNGHHNGSIPIIVDNKPYKSSGIYDEIGKEPNGTCSSSKLDEIVPVHAENVYAVPNKTKKTPTSGRYICCCDERSSYVYIVVVHRQVCVHVYVIEACQVYEYVAVVCQCKYMHVVLCVKLFVCCCDV